MNINNIEKFLINFNDQMKETLKSLDINDALKIIEVFKNIKENNGKIMIAGNGGSAAMASHVAVDLTKAAAVRSTTFNESDLITCFGNDFGYENWISKAIEYYYYENDAVILISSSGQSPNIINAAKKSIELGLPVITLSGFSEQNSLKKIGNINLWVDSQSYNIVEMTHHTWLVSLIDALIEEEK